MRIIAEKMILITDHGSFLRPKNDPRILVQEIEVRKIEIQEIDIRDIEIWEIEIPEIEFRILICNQKVD